jgi:hypothetical protein
MGPPFPAGDGNGITKDHPPHRGPWPSPKTLVLTKEKKMRFAKLLGLALLAALAFVALAAPAVAALNPGEALPLPDVNEEWALIAGSICVLGAMALRIGKSPQLAVTAVTTHQLAPRATTVISQPRNAAFTTRELSTTGITDINSLQINEFESELPNPQHDRKTWNINLIMAC